MGQVLHRRHYDSGEGARIDGARKHTADSQGESELVGRGAGQREG